MRERESSHPLTISAHGSQTISEGNGQKCNGVSWALDVNNRHVWVFHLTEVIRLDECFTGRQHHILGEEESELGIYKTVGGMWDSKVEE